jgi:hypothetical protein
MNTPLMTLPLPTLAELKKRRVLLIDASHPQRDLRAEVMRKLGIDVDCAADIAEARAWWRADLYDLVLLNVEKGRGHRDRFCDDIRRATPPQRMAFLVGKPEYLADSPGTDEELLNQNGYHQAAVGDVKAALSADLGHLSQRWGILEASRRISAVRSACTARTRAMRDRPAPLRDAEGRPSKQTTLPTTLDDLLREELQ